MKPLQIAAPPASHRAVPAPAPRRRQGPAVTDTLNALAVGLAGAASDAGAIEYASWLRWLRQPSP